MKRSLVLSCLLVTCSMVHAQGPCDQLTSDHSICEYGMNFGYRTANIYSHSMSHSLREAIPENLPNVPRMLPINVIPKVVPEIVVAVTRMLAPFPNYKEIRKDQNPCSMPEYVSVCEAAVKVGMGVLVREGVIDAEVNKGVGAEVGKVIVSTVVSEVVHAIADKMKEIHVPTPNHSPDMGGSRPGFGGRGPVYDGNNSGDPAPAPCPAPGWGNP